MEKLLTSIGAITVVIIGLFLASVMSGTFIWMLWDSLGVWYPYLTQYLPTEPSWWEVVKGVWITSLIIRIFIPTVKIKNKD